MKLDIKTSRISGTGTIHQKVEQVDNEGVRTVLREQVLDTLDKEVAAQLINMGWRPPLHPDLAICGKCGSQITHRRGQGDANPKG